MKRFLVTGGAGFIGSHLVRALHSAGHQTVVVDDLSTGLRANLSDISTDLRVGSVLDTRLIADAIAGCDGVFHLAALVAVPDTVMDWLGGHAVNLIGTINVFEAACAAGGVPVVYASSAAIYGNQSAGICQEDSTLPAPISPYGADKLACEHHARAFGDIHALPSFGLRFFNAYGPGQSDNSPYSGVISKFVKNAVDDVPHTVFGDGQQTRDFIYVADIIAGLMAAMAYLDTQKQAYVSNLCTGVSCSLLDVIAALKMLYPDSARHVSFTSNRAGDVVHSRGCTQRMANMLKITASTSLHDGLSQVLAAT